MSVTHIDRCRYSHGKGRDTVLLLYGTVQISYPDLTHSYAGDLGARLGIYTLFPSQLRASQWISDSTHKIFPLCNSTRHSPSPTFKLQMEFFFFRLWKGECGERRIYFYFCKNIIIKQCEMNCSYLRTDTTDMAQFLLVSAKRSWIPKKATSYPYLCKSFSAELNFGGVHTLDILLMNSD